MSKQVTVYFSRVFHSGNLVGLTHNDRITHVDRDHAARWVKGIRRNSRLGRLDYRLSLVTTVNGGER